MDGTYISLGGSAFKKPTSSQCGFDESPASGFNLRIGPNYSKHKKKAPSDDGLYEMVSMDHFSCDTVYTQLGHIMDIPEPKHKSIRKGIPSTFICNVAIPNVKPQMMNAPTEGPCVHICFVMQLKESTVEMMKDWANASAQLKLLEEWCAKAPDDSKFRGRFKMMGKVHNWDEMSLPSMLKSYNAKPILITASGSTYFNKERDYVEECANVFHWNYIARRALDSLQSKIPGMQLSFTCTIEARSDEEMPERCLWAARIQNFYPFNEQRRLTPEAYAWLRAQAVRDQRISSA